MAMKNFDEEEVFKVYKTAYSNKIEWNKVLEDDVFDFLSLFEKANNTALSLVLPAMLTLTTSLAGPSTTVQTMKGTFLTSLNTYCLAICDPGGGKTVTYEKVVTPVLDAYTLTTGKSINLETYTTAGIHIHQVENSGYGFISSDEGQRFLSSIQAKERNGESERSLLCKMWSGRGDSSTLSSGTRGFKTTSMSMFIPIQPQPLLSELHHFQGNDGFLDRFLFFTVKPKLYLAAEIRQHHQLLHEIKSPTFDSIFMHLFEDHKDGKCYELDSEAQRKYDSLMDGYSELLRQKYDADDENEDKENIPGTQPENLHITSSKDTIHILRLSAVLHILNYYIGKAINPNTCGPFTTMISSDDLQKAMYLYNCLSLQKSIFLQAIRSTTNKEVTRLAKVKTMQEKVVRGLLLHPGPMVPLRQLQRHIKGALVENIKFELEILQANDFGKVVTFKSVKLIRDFFCKPAPETVNADHPSLKLVNVSIEQYRRLFFNAKEENIQQHYQYELLANAFE